MTQDIKDNIPVGDIGYYVVYHILSLAFLAYKILE